MVGLILLRIRLGLSEGNEWISLRIYGRGLHAVEIKSDSTLNDDASMRVFQDVVLEAIAQADDDYEVKPHRFTQRSIHGCAAGILRVSRRCRA